MRRKKEDEPMSERLDTDTHHVTLSRERYESLLSEVVKARSGVTINANTNMVYLTADQYSAMVAQRDGLMQQRDQYQAAAKRAEHDHEEAIQKLYVARQDNEGLQKSNVELATERVQLRASVSRATERELNMGAQLEAANRDKGKLLKETELLKIDVKNREERLDAAVLERDRVRRDTGYLSAELQSVRQQNIGLQDKAAHDKDRIDRLIDTHDRDKERISSLVRNNARLSTQVADLRRGYSVHGDSTGVQTSEPGAHPTQEVANLWGEKLVEDLNKINSVVNENAAPEWDDSTLRQIALDAALARRNSPNYLGEATVSELAKDYLRFLKGEN